MSTTQAFATRSGRRRFSLRGLVQGLGVRPTVAKLAVTHRLDGFVRNANRGVEIVVTGPDERLTEFEIDLRTRFHDVTLSDEGFSQSADAPIHGFSIAPSLREEPVSTVIPPDIASCPQCLAEVADPNSRRFEYPFTTCTICGPRYSIIRQMPYDRAGTSMANFHLCSECQREYTDPTDRRFHSQTNGCPRCGPRCWAAMDGNPSLAENGAAVRLIADAISNGRIVAMKGLGGYQLVCDATNESAVQRLRDRKRRPTKPLAVMVRDLVTASDLAHVSKQEQRALESPANPIVLLRGKTSPLAKGVCCGLHSMGVMLPTTPLHDMLVKHVGRPLVVTSGNVAGNPISFREADAVATLGEIAEGWLHHDREIIRPVDDSVVQCFADQTMTIRAARGIAPIMLLAKQMPRLAKVLIATGGHQKNAMGLATPTHFVLGPHIGDLDSEASRDRMRRQTDDLTELLGFESPDYCCDQHPDYFSSRLAQERDKDATTVQHHHAHVATGMLEHSLVDQTVLGIAFDGSGSGNDNTVWGGELLLATNADFTRVGHLRPFPLLGGAAAIRQPWRIALALLNASCHDSDFKQRATAIAPHLSPANFPHLLRQAIQTTSMGRLFDGVAAITLGLRESHFEGEPAMRLESACDPNETGTYQFALSESETLEMDWRPVITELLTDQSKKTPGQIAMKWHRAVAQLVVEVANRYSNLPPILCGGVFQNRTLLELIQQISERRGISFRYAGVLPTNDGGLAIGQLLVASARRHPRKRIENGGTPCA